MKAKRLLRLVLLVVSEMWVLFTVYYLHHDRGVPLWYTLLWGVLGSVGVGSLLWGSFRMRKSGLAALKWSPVLQFFIVVVIVAATAVTMGRIASTGGQVDTAFSGLALLIFFYSEGLSWAYRRLARKLK